MAPDLLEEQRGRGSGCGAGVLNVLDAVELLLWWRLIWGQIISSASSPQHQCFSDLLAPLLPGGGLPFSFTLLLRRNREVTVELLG